MHANDFESKVSWKYEIVTITYTMMNLDIGNYVEKISATIFIVRNRVSCYGTCLPVVFVRVSFPEFVGYCFICFAGHYPDRSSRSKPL